MNPFVRRRLPKYLAVCEYWVYLPKPQMPPQNLIMANMMKGCTRNGPPIPTVETNEALLFSDIRLHVALVLRSKNPHLFRPDLFEQHIEPTPQILASLGEAQALAKVRYLSEEPLADLRHVRFVPSLAVAIGDMGGAGVVFDSVAEYLSTVDQLRAQACGYSSTDQPGYHVRVVWVPGAGGGQAATKGLLKAGLPELLTPVTRNDHESIVCEVLGMAADALWREGRVLDSLRLKCYDDTFLVKIEPSRKSPLQARILRIAEP